MPNHKILKTDSKTYSEIKGFMNSKYSWQDIMNLDRGATRIVRNRGYFSLDYWNYKDLIRWYPDGRIKVNLGTRSVKELRNSWRQGVQAATSTGYYTPWSVTTRLTRYIPHPLYFYAFGYHTMVSTSLDHTDGREVPRHITIDANGNIITPLGSTEDGLKMYYRKQYAKRALTRRRGQYWVRRARNLYRKRCSRRGRNCAWRHTWPRPTAPIKLDCGCELYRKNIQFRYSAQAILKERNATVRTAMIKIYGVSKFFEDVGARLIAKAREYQLLCLEFGKAKTNKELTDRERRQLKLHALKMVCPSTGQTYVNLVPNNITGVEQALNWMYNTTHYFDTVGKET